MSSTVILRGRLSVAEDRAVYLCELGNGRYVRLSQNAYDLYRSVQAGVSFDELAAIARKSRPDVDARDIERAYLGVAEKLARAEDRAEQRRAGFWLTFTLVPAQWVARISRLFTGAFHPAAAVLLVAAIMLAGVFAIRNDVIANTIAAEHFGSGYLLFIASLLAHELGHAAACVRYGAAPGPIGATMYLMYPALFADVSTAWALNRRQRVAVDLGGTYFQLIVATGYVIAYYATGWEPLQIALLLIGAACMLSLNPILKFDGYWVVADALGITNLGEVPFRLGAAMWARLRGRRLRPLPWSWRTITLLGMYTAATAVFWVYFSWFLVGSIDDAAYSLSRRIDSVWSALGNGELPGRAILALLSTMFMLAFVATIAWRLVVTIVQFARARVKRLTGTGGTTPEQSR